jgi:hypothetical protein
LRDRNEFPDFINDALKIIRLGAEKGATLRLMGACAIRLHCPKFGYIHKEMKRTVTDIDLVTYGKFRPLVKKVLTELGYSPGAGALYGLGRHIYYDYNKNIEVDVFFDKLEMCHTVDFRGRLELDYPTITVSDLLLEKMQIVKIDEKDVKDTIMLLREHDIGEEERETVNREYITKVLSDDWGFYYTFTENLKKVKKLLGIYKALTSEDQRNVEMKISELLDAIEKVPKTFKWKVRERIGTSKKWYRDVEERS